MKTDLPPTPHAARRIDLGCVPTTLFLLLLLFMAAWLPRATNLDAFVTPDERRWLQRSANFLVALDQRDFAATYQAGHPGVTVMWAGTAGFLTLFPTYVREVHARPLDEESFDAWIRARGTPSLLQLLVAGRRWLVLVISLLIAATYLPLSSFLGSTPAFVATLFVAWEPFHLALSRQLHPDGLLATLALLALAAFSAWLYGSQRFAYLLLAGVATGLAILTKSPALVLPFFMFLALMEAWIVAWHAPPHRRVLWRGAWQLAAFGLLTFVACWPVTWTLPQDAVARMVNLAIEYSQQGHELPLFFMGTTSDDPGPLFYPVAFLMRTTPATILGLMLALWLFWHGDQPLHTPRARQSVLTLLAFVALFVVAITLAQKKMDRYLLPAMPALTVVAAMGWVGLAHKVAKRTSRAFPQTRLGAATTLATVAVGLGLLHAFFSARHFPYYLTYYNPLAGGSRTAPQVMMIGWGEGLEAAARWLNEQPLSQRRVVAWYGDGPLSYYLDPTIEVQPFFADGETTEEYWFGADYAVLYVNQWQRENPNRDLINYFMATSPAHVVSFGGLDLVRIYDLRQLTPPPVTSLHRVEATRWNEEIELAGYYLKNETVFPGEAVEFALFWRSVAAVSQDYTLQLELRDAAGSSLWHAMRSPAGVETSDWPAGKLWRDTYAVELPLTLAPGTYALVTTFHTPGGAIVPLTHAAGEANPADGDFAVVTLRVQEPTVLQNANAVWQDAGITRVAAYAGQVTPGSALLVDVDAAIQGTSPRKLSLRLVNAAGESIAQNDQELWPTMRFRLVLPEDATPGSYRLSAVLYDPETLAALPAQHGALSVEIVGIEVQ